jgi:uncharacterized protein
MTTQTEDLIPSNDAPLASREQGLPPQPSSLHKIFIGADGLRAGWSILIFIALFAALMAAASAIGHKLHPPAPKTAATVTDKSITLRSTYIDESIPFLAVLLVTWIMSKIERRPNSVYGLGGGRKLSHFFSGLAWGVTCLSLLVFILWRTGLLVTNGRLLVGGDILRYGTLWLLGFLIVGLLEEYLTRGYLLFTLARGLAGLYKWAFKTRHSATLGFWTAALLLSLLFGLGHKGIPDESPIGLLSAGLASMVFCLSLWRTGSLWWAIGFHATWDWAQSFLYGVADSGSMVKFHLLATHPVGNPILSGGATGPEGSIFVLAILFLIVLIILFTLPRSNRGYTTTLSTQQQPIEA